MSKILGGRIVKGSGKQYRAIKHDSHGDVVIVGQYRDTRRAADLDALQDFNPARFAVYMIETSDGKRTKMSDAWYDKANTYYLERRRL